MEAIISLLIFVICLILQVPVAFSLGAASVVYLLFFSNVPMILAIQSLFTSCDSFSMLCIPFFVMAGEVMMAGELSQKLVNFFSSIMGNVKGKLGIICVITCAFFAAISGSGAATVACIGGILIPSMVKQKYDKAYSASLACCAGALGPVIPPSVPAIVYAVTANVSISTLFLSGFSAGIVLMVLLAAYNCYIAGKRGYGVENNSELSEEKRSFFEIFKDSIWAVLTPFIILGGIYGGFCSPTEAAVLATVYALVVSLFLYRSLKIKDIPAILSKTVSTTGTIMILMGCASAFGRVLTMEQIPTTIARFILSLTDNKVLVLLFVNIFFLIVGMLMETSAAIVILVPIFLPIVKGLGVDPIHFGAIVVFNLAIGLCTPPVGLNLFVGTRVANVPVDKMLKHLMPMIAIMIIVLLIITYCEPLALFLPRLLDGYAG